MKYTINTTESEDVLLEKTGRNVQEVLEGKIEELVNQGHKVSTDELIEAYRKAEPSEKIQFDSLKASIKERNELATEISTN